MWPTAVWELLLDTDQLGQVMLTRNCWNIIQNFWRHLKSEMFGIVLAIPKLSIPANIYLFKVNNRNKKKVWNMFKVNSKNNKTTRMTSFWYIYYLSTYSHLLLVFLLFIFTKYTLAEVE